METQIRFYIERKTNEQHKEEAEQAELKTCTSPS